MIVVDASVLVVALADDGDDGDAARVRLLDDANIHAPHLIDLEVASVLRRSLREGRIEARRATLALKDLIDLALVRYDHLPFIRRIWELRSNLTPYDAAYVALAETLECTLVTGDRRIARAPGLHCRIEFLSV